MPSLGRMHPMSDEARQAAEEKMRDAGAHPEAIAAFLSALDRLLAGEEAMIPTAELEPADEVPALEGLPEADSEALGEFVMIKLNGGLATSMGLQQPKSLVRAREDLTFLDIIVGQTLALRRRHDVRLPLLLMNSDATRAETEQALARYPELAVDELPLEFEQSMVPKLMADGLLPASWPSAPQLEWCPPGHGDIYGALRRSGLLAGLLKRGFRYAMVSNSDNLGATFDPRIATHVASEEITFLMEVVQGTAADRKGGHIARQRADGRLVLRETAQTPEEDEESFRDYRRWRYYNTNNLWIDLKALSATLEQHQGVLALPLIVNRKTVDPRDSSSPAVLQLESAMGAAIGSFEGARLLRVPRTRFVPVKTTDDLLVLRSDVYGVSEDMVVAPVPSREGKLPYVELDKRYYRMLDEFESRFPSGAPSLLRADQLLVEGDVTFEQDVAVRGEVELKVTVPTRIRAGTVLE